MECWVIALAARLRRLIGMFAGIGRDDREGSIGER